MSDIGPDGSSTHPLGWAFLGIGTLIWAAPLAILLGHPLYLAELGADAFGVALVVAGAAGVGLLLEGLLVPVERTMLRLSRIGKYEPSGDKWRDAWLVRWQHSGADDEFKRNEALTSFARAYILHCLLGTACWALLAYRDDGLLAATLTLLGGSIAVGVLWYIWYRRTRLIFTLVNTAAAWARSSTDQALSPPAT